jgi:hypothetical protein
MSKRDSILINTFAALEKLKEANNGNPITAIVWTSDMTNSARQYLSPNDYVIQIWSKGTLHCIVHLIQFTFMKESPLNENDFVHCFSHG